MKELANFCGRGGGPRPGRGTDARSVVTPQNDSEGTWECDLQESEANEASDLTGSAGAPGRNRTIRKRLRGFFAYEKRVGDFAPAIDGKNRDGGGLAENLRTFSAGVVAEQVSLAKKPRVAIGGCFKESLVSSRVIGGLGIFATQRD